MDFRCLFKQGGYTVKTLTIQAENLHEAVKKANAEGYGEFELWEGKKRVFFAPLDTINWGARIDGYIAQFNPGGFGVQNANDNKQNFANSLDYRRFRLAIRNDGQ